LPTTRHRCKFMMCEPLCIAAELAPLTHVTRKGIKQV